MDITRQPDASAAEPLAIRNHRRFALTDVRFEDQSVGGATIDVWQNAAGRTCWSARVLMQDRDPAPGGVLSGTARDGGVLRGPVVLVGSGPGVGGGRGPVIIEWRGVGALRRDDASDTAG